MINDPVLLIIDAYNLFIKNYIVVPSLTPNGEMVGGVKGFLKSLQSFLFEFKVEKVLVVWDGVGGSKKRRESYKGYKEGRKPLQLNKNLIQEHLTQDELFQNRKFQFIRTIEYLNQLPVIQLMIDKVEADDVVSFICLMEEHKGLKKVIISADKDFYQLCSDEVSLYRTTQKEHVNGADVLSLFNISPMNFALARSVCGDASDNIKGVERAGLATLAKRFPLLAEETSKTIDELIQYAYEQIESGSKIKLYKNVLENKQLIEENYKITQLYSPSISVQNTDKIRNTINNFIPTFLKTEITKMMIKDGFLDVNWERMFEVSRGLVFKHKTNSLS